MSTQIFKRIEQKYLISDQQYGVLRQRLADYMQVDEYDWYDIHNLYYDNCADEFIRRSLAKPKFKEKMRLRTYGLVTDDSSAYFELKKKYRGVVYKRRTKLCYAQARTYLQPPPTEFRPDSSSSQIQRELEYFWSHYQVTPKIFIGYTRLALFCPTDPHLRLTFDRDIIYRYDHLVLDSAHQNTRFDFGADYIVEIKTATALPLWLTNILDQMRLYPGSMSKYGSIYMANLNLQGVSKA